MVHSSCPNEWFSHRSEPVRALLFKQMCSHPQWGPLPTNPCLLLKWPLTTPQINEWATCKGVSACSSNLKASKMQEQEEERLLGLTTARQRGKRAVGTRTPLCWAAIAHYFMIMSKRAYPSNLPLTRALLCDTDERKHSVCTQRLASWLGLKNKDAPKKVA